MILYNKEQVEKKIKDYLELQGDSCCRDDFDYFKNMKSLEEAIEFASLSKYIDMGVEKRHPHQRRFSRETLVAGYNKLCNVKNQLKRGTDFDAIFGIVKNKVKDIHGVGPLYIYDVATRIGSYLGKYPDKVYLHCGTRDGARILGMNYKADILLMEEFYKLSEEFKSLKAYEVEDFLCICKDQFIIAQKNYHFEKNR